LKHLDFDGLGSNFSNALKPFSQLLSYCFSKVIGEIVEGIIRLRSQGKLEVLANPLLEEEVLKVGNKIVEGYLRKAKKVSLVQQKVIQKAFQSFSNEFYAMHYDKCYSLLKKQAALSPQGLSQSIRLTRDLKGKINLGELKDRWKVLQSKYKK